RVAEPAAVGQRREGGSVFATAHPPEGYHTHAPRASVTDRGCTRMRPPALSSTDSSIGPPWRGANVRAAAIQLNATDDVDRNLQTADRLVRQAAGLGAEMVVLPG